MREPHKAPSIAPVSGPQWTEEVEEEAEKGVGINPSFHFEDLPGPSAHSLARFKPSPDRQRWGAAMQVIKATVTWKR